MGVAAMVDPILGAKVFLLLHLANSGTEHQAVLGFVLLVFVILVLLYQQAYGTDIPKIKGIPEAPGAVPFYGHLKILGQDHPTKFEEWGAEHDWPVVQARFGTRRVLVLNSFQAAQEFIVKNATATIDRSLFWTFHNILSTTQGGTIGTSPWDEATKRRRTAVQSYMTRPAIQRSGPMLDVETSSVIRDLYHDCGDGKDIQPEVYFKRMALNVAMVICYATRFEDVKDPLLLKILNVAETVSTFRSTNKNVQDYVPLLRYLPSSERSALAASTRQIRDKWLESLFSKVKQNVQNGTAKPCITQSLLDETSKSKLTLPDIRSINVSLVSGGFETVSTTGLAGLGVLSGSSEGWEMQERAYNDFIKLYGSVDTAWEQVVTEEKSPYMSALIKEMLRYYAAIPFVPPRQTTKEFVWNGVTIPKGITIIQNAQAINHGEDMYGKDARAFRPERWLEGETSDRPAPAAPYHYSFGAGSRACPAVAISNRILYAAFARMILLFHVRPGKKTLDTDYVGFNTDTTLQTCKVRPYAIRMELRGDKEDTEKLLFKA